MISLEEALKGIKGCVAVHVGHVHFMTLSDERNEKAMENVKHLGSIVLTHAPGKMMQKVGSCSMPKKGFLLFVKQHPELEKCFTVRPEKDWVDSKKGCENVEYETDVWGDDWDDSPASSNCGPPYGGKRISLETGDLVIVIKHGVKRQEQ